MGLPNQKKAAPPASASATLVQAAQPAEAALEEHAPPEAVIPPPPPHMPAAQPSSWLGLAANLASLGLYGYFTAPKAPVEPPITQGGAAAASALEENEPSDHAQDAAHQEDPWAIHAAPLEGAQDDPRAEFLLPTEEWAAHTATDPHATGPLSLFSAPSPEPGPSRKESSSDEAAEFSPALQPEKQRDSKTGALRHRLSIAAPSPTRSYAATVGLGTPRSSVPCAVASIASGPVGFWVSFAPSSRGVPLPHASNDIRADESEDDDEATLLRKGSKKDSKTRRNWGSSRTQHNHKKK